MKNTYVRFVRRPLNLPPGRKRTIAVAATLVVFAAAVSATPISNAGTGGNRSTKAGSCGPGTNNRQGGGQQGRNCLAGTRSSSSSRPSATASTRPTLSEEDQPLDNDCEDSNLQAHDGFQNGERCVSIEFGEIASADNNATLLITGAPRSVRANQPFALRVSSRNLVRDRFLPAAAGGFYLESSFLNEDGLTRGHFHTACRMLTSLRNAPDPEPPPAFFVATEDFKGGAEPDEVIVNVTGLAQPGQAQCAVWSGDGSHRMPMMVRANQIPAFDSVRITVE